MRKGSPQGKHTHIRIHIYIYIYNTVDGAINNRVAPAQNTRFSPLVKGVDTRAVFDKLIRHSSKVAGTRSGMAVDSGEKGFRARK